MADLPLLELFIQLREAGLPLGIDEYQLALKALQGGFGLEDRQALKRLCQALWVKSEEEQRIFNNHFEQVMASDAMYINLQSAPPQSIVPRKTRYFAWAGAFLIGVTIVFVGSEDAKGWMKKQFIHLLRNQSPSPEVATPETSTPFELPSIGTDSPTAITAEKSPSTPSPTDIPTTPPKTFKKLSPAEKARFEKIFWNLVMVIALGTGSAMAWGTDRLLIKFFMSRDRAAPPTPLPFELSPDITQNINDEIQVAVMQQTVALNMRTIPDSFSLGAEYLPVTQRQMKRSWRYLYRPVRKGPPIELDLDATVHRISERGFFMEPALVPRRVNRAELYLLIDQEGSMIPFQLFSQRLIITALRGGRLGNTSIYYFHNCPIRYLYHDAECHNAELIHEVFVRLSSPQAGIMIFSDAGAARGGFNRERIQLTVAFLNELKQHVRYVTWLNPMPRSRWTGTTAAEIARMVPMFEVSRLGLDQAINVLRGRHIKYGELD